MENLLEFNVLTRGKGSLATWASNKFEKKPSWMDSGFKYAEIPLTTDTIFEIIDGNPKKVYPVIGTSKEKIILHTDVYSSPPSDGGILQGTVAWTQDPSKYFKELKQGSAISWGSNTDALETAQCLGVYLKAEDALGDAKSLGVAGAKAKWNPEIKSILSNGQDWDSGGVTKILAKMGNMPDANWLEMLLLAKGMKNFLDSWGKNLGGSYNIIHGSIKDYYKAEIKNQTTTPDSKDNTADMILANVSSTDVIDAIGSQPIGYDDKLYYCHTKDKSKSIKFYQVSLKKAHDAAQLGKLTASLKAIYKLPDSSELFQSIVNQYMIKHGYEMNELNEAWILDKLKQGVAAVKSIASDWFAKIVGLVNKIKEWGTAFIRSFDREIPTGRPNSYQLGLMTKALKESGRLQEGEFLTEARQTKESINDLLRNANQSEARTILKEVNDQIIKINNSFSGNEFLISQSQRAVPDSQYTASRNRKNWTFGDLIKLFANATALNAFTTVVFKNDGDISALKDQMIDLEREIYFGRTTLPLFKVYGAKTPTDTNTIERLGTADEFVSKERTSIEGAGYQWPVVGFNSTTQKNKYYNLEGMLLTGSNTTQSEPEYTQCRMGTNKADAFSFVFEGTGIVKWTSFKTKFGIK
jgi:hypothetical protein